MSLVVTLCNVLLRLAILAFSYVVFDVCLRIAVIKELRYAGDIIEVSMFGFQTFYWYTSTSFALAFVTFLLEIIFIVFQVSRKWNYISLFAVLFAIFSLVLLLPTAISGFMIFIEAKHQSTHLFEIEAQNISGHYIEGEPFDAFVKLGHALRTDEIESEENMDKIQKFIDKMQEHHKCCGLEGPGDWMNNYKPLDNSTKEKDFSQAWWTVCTNLSYECVVPRSCCISRDKLHCNKASYDGKLADPKQIHSEGCKQAILLQLAVIVRAIAVYITILNVVVLVDCGWWIVMSWRGKRRQRQLDLKNWNKAQNDVLQQENTTV